jgi:hypothetical protein
MAHPASELRRGLRQGPFLHDLYPRLTSFRNLLAAAKAAQRGKRFRPDVLAFNSRLEAEIFQLQNELRSFTVAGAVTTRVVTIQVWQVPLPGGLPLELVNIPGDT